MRLSLLLVLLAACGPKNGPVPEKAPRCMTEKNEVKIEIIRTLVDGEDYPRALELITQMRDEGVEREELDLLQGICLREQGVYEGAERSLLKAEGSLPKEPAVQTALCVLYADTAEYDRAIGHCQRATELDEGDHEAWNNYGYLLLTVGGDARTAREAIQKAVDLDGANPRYRNNLAFAQVATGDHRAALRTFLTTGTPADAHYNVGAAFEREGDASTARTYYERALKYDADHSPADLALARLNQGQGEEN